jgi:hypothetical protein
VSHVLTPLDLRYVDGDTWLLLTDFRAISEGVGLIEVGVGFRTDFNSVPRLLTNILPREEYGESAVLHDRLYQTAGTGLRAVTRAEADGVHREFLIWKGAPPWKVRAMYWGLRAFGSATWNRYRKADGQKAQL